jgi:2-Cys peroxiredoxin 5
MKAKGVAEIVCVSVNDPFVMAAWGEAHKAEGKVRMLADTNAELTKALGVDMNLAVLGGVRSKRWSAIVDDGAITSWNLEPEGAPTGLTCSLAPAILEKLA